jgi:penicillin amidase
MKTIKRILLALLIIILLALITGFFLIRHISNRAVPDYNEDVVVQGLVSPVDVLRDEFGVPHVYAQNEEDLYRVVGYLMAQDRLWQMDLLRRVTSGRLSEIFGADMVDTDHLLRSLRIPEKSEMVIKKSDPVIIGYLDAFADGVNQYMTACQKKLPFEFAVLGYQPDPWETVHSMNLIGYMCWNLTSGWTTEMVLHKIHQIVDQEKFVELLPDLSIQEPVYPDYTLSGIPEPEIDMMAAVEKIRELGVQVFSGSNNWAVSGKLTESGFPVMANDMHLGLDVAPGIWYQMHQSVEGKLNVTGVMLPGAPFIVCGHNDSIAWGMTNVTVDNIDFYVETINPEDSNQYKFNGEWKDMKVVEEKIAIKGGDTVIRMNRFTHRGPVISGFRDIEDKVISSRWIGNEYSNELRTVYLLNRAGNWQDFTDAVSTFIAISQNIVYSDVAGNIGLYCAAGVPVREGNPAFIAPGDTDLFDWQGLVPFKRLPHAFNPPEGFVVSANNKTTGPDYPYYIGYWYDLPNRYNRIVEMIRATGKHNNETIKMIQTDQHSKWAEKILPAVLPLVDESNERISGNTVFQSLKSWGYDFSVESVEAMLFEVFYIKMIESIFMDEMGENLYEEYLRNDVLASYVIDKIVSGGQISWCDDVSTPGIVEDFSDIVNVSFIRALEWLESSYGTDQENWRWGRHHQLSFKHSLGSVNILNKIFKLERGPFPVGGSYHTVCPYSYPLGNPFVVNHGASERHIFDLSDWDASLTVIPTGSSGIPASDFYCNQSEMYVNMEYHADPFSREEVERLARYHAVLTGE